MCGLPSPSGPLACGAPSRDAGRGSGDAGVGRPRATALVDLTQVPRTRTASTPPLLIDPGQTSSSGTDTVEALGNEHVRIGSGHSGGTDPGQQYRLKQPPPVPGTCVHKPQPTARWRQQTLQSSGTYGQLLRFCVGRVAPTSYAAVNYRDAGAEHPYSDATATGRHLSGLVGATNGGPTDARSPARPGRA